METLIRDNAYLSEELTAVAHQVVRLEERLSRCKCNIGGDPQNLIAIAQDSAPNRADLQAICRRYYFPLTVIDEVSAKSSAPLISDMNGLNSSIDRTDPPASRAHGTFAEGKITARQGFFEVILNHNDQTFQHFDYQADYRRMAFTDLPCHSEIHKVHVSSNIEPLDPSKLLIWLDEAMPRSQDDVYPLFLLCKGMIRKLANHEVKMCMEREIELNKHILILHEEKDKIDRDLKQSAAESKFLKESLQNMRLECDSLRNKVALLSGANVVSDLASPSATNQQMSAKNILESECSMLRKTIMELEYQLKLHENSTLNQQSRVIDSSQQSRLLSTWTGALGVDEKCQLFKSILHSDMPWSEIDLSSVEMSALHSLCRKLIQHMKSACPSFVTALATAMESSPKELPLMLVKMYESEHLLKSDIDLNKSSKDLARMVSKKDFIMVWDRLRDQFRDGDASVWDLVFYCTGKSKEQVMLDTFQATPEEFGIFKNNREFFYSWMSRSDISCNSVLKRLEVERSIGCFKLDKARTAVPMEERHLHVLIAALFSTKIEWDTRNRAKGSKCINLIRATTAYFHFQYGIGSLSEIKLCEMLSAVLCQLSKHNEGKPVSYRALTFARLAGIENSVGWRERASNFVLSFWDKMSTILSRHRNTISRREGSASTDRSLEDQKSVFEYLFFESDFLVPAVDCLSVAKQLARENGFENVDFNNAVQFAIQSNQDFVQGIDTTENLASRILEHQFGLRYVLESGETTCVWYDAFCWCLLQTWEAEASRRDKVLLQRFDNFDRGQQGKIDLGDFCAIMKPYDETFADMDCALLFSEIVTPDDCFDKEIWLLKLHMLLTEDMKLTIPNQIVGDYRMPNCNADDLEPFVPSKEDEAVESIPVSEDAEVDKMD